LWLRPTFTNCSASWFSPRWVRGQATLEAVFAAVFVIPLLLSIAMRERWFLRKTYLSREGEAAAGGKSL